jgi:hypothetical protein
LCEPSTTGSAGADLPDPTIIAQVAQLHMTRQQSQSEKPSVYSPAHGPVHGGNRETSVIVADPAANVSEPFLFAEKKVPATTTTVAAAEESVSPQEKRQISESIETFSEPIDATVAQKGRIEVVSHCTTPPPSVIGTSENSFDRRQETEQTPAPVVLTSVSIPVTPPSASFPFTTETLSEIRKKRIAEKQQQQQTQLFKQESSEQQPSSIQVEVPSSTGAVIFVSSPAESSTVIPNTKGPAPSSSQNVEIHAASRVLESNAPINVNPVPNEINSSNTRNPLQLPPSAQQQRQHQQQQQPPIQQPQQLQVEVQRGRGANEKIHWVLNALIGVTVGCICVLLNRILTRSLEMK